MCKECGVSAVHEGPVLVSEVVAIEEHMLGTACYAMQPSCSHYRAFLDLYGARGPARRKAADRLICAATEHAKWMLRAKEDLEYSELPKSKRRQKRRKPRRKN